MVKFLLLCAAGTFLLWGVTSAQDCKAEITAFHECVELDRKAQRKPKINHKLVHERIVECLKKSGCNEPKRKNGTKVSPEAPASGNGTLIEAASRPARSPKAAESKDRGNGQGAIPSEIEQCFDLVRLDAKKTIETCVVKQVPTFAFPEEKSGNGSYHDSDDEDEDDDDDDDDDDEGSSEESDEESEESSEESGEEGGRSETTRSRRSVQRVTDGAANGNGKGNGREKGRDNGSRGEGEGRGKAHGRGRRPGPGRKIHRLWFMLKDPEICETEGKGEEAAACVEKVFDELHKPETCNLSPFARLRANIKRKCESKAKCLQKVSETCQGQMKTGRSALCNCSREIRTPAKFASYIENFQTCLRERRTNGGQGMNVRERLNQFKHFQNMADAHLSELCPRDDKPDLCAARIPRRKPQHRPQDGPHGDRSGTKPHEQQDADHKSNPSGSSPPKDGSPPSRDGSPPPNGGSPPPKDGSPPPNGRSPPPKDGSSRPSHNGGAPVSGPPGASHNQGSNGGRPPGGPPNGGRGKN